MLSPGRYPKIWVAPLPSNSWKWRFRSGSHNYLNIKKSRWWLLLGTGPYSRYCWRNKSCTSWYVVYPTIYRVLYIQGGAGFLPSTVSCPFLLFDYGRLMITEKNINCRPEQCEWILPSGVISHPRRIPVLNSYMFSSYTSLHQIHINVAWPMVLHYGPSFQRVSVIHNTPEV